MSELGEYTPRRNSFQFLNVKLLHNQSPENYIQLSHLIGWCIINIYKFKVWEKHDLMN